MHPASNSTLRNNKFPTICMNDQSLSPFLERPSLIDNDGLVNRERLSRLEYEVRTLKTEKKLLELSKNSAIGRYEELLLKKNDELARLQNNFDFVYNERKDLKLKLANQKNIAEKDSDDLGAKAESLKNENKRLLQDIEKLRRSHSIASGKADHLRADLNRELAANSLYQERIAALERENRNLVEINDESLTRIKELSLQAEQNDDQKKIGELQLRMLALQKTNSQLNMRVDSLLQHKTSVEILKQKNNTLLKKAQALDEMEERNARLEHANLELQVKFEEYFGFVEATVDKSNSSGKDAVLEFVLQFRNLQNTTLVLQEKLDDAQRRVTDLEEQLDEKNLSISQDLQPQIEYLQKTASAREQELAELRNMKLLNTKEIEFLRGSLKSYDQIFASRKGPETTPDPKVEATNQYMSGLEKLVDDYKTELELLKKRIATTPLPARTPTKRPRIVDEDDTKTRAVKSLRSENLELLVQVKDLKVQIKVLEEKLDLVQRSTSAGRIFELRSNPFNRDQVIKQETLNLLRQENKDLIMQYVEGSSEVDLVPRSVFARQEDDKQALQATIDQLHKRVKRLQCVFAEKSKEIIAVISRYFGYTIELIPSSVNPTDICAKIKLTSRYLASSDGGKTAPYLMLDVRSKSLKANGSFKFKSMCEELVSQWVNEKNQIPCFLSALNLKIYEERNENLL